MSGLDKYNFRRLARSQRWAAGIKGPKTGRVYNPNGRRGKKGYAKSQDKDSEVYNPSGRRGKEGSSWTNTKSNNEILVIFFFIAISYAYTCIDNMVVTFIICVVFALYMIGELVSLTDEEKEMIAQRELELKKEVEQAKKIIANEIEKIKNETIVEIDNGWTEKQKEFAWLFGKVPESDYISISFNGDSEDKYISSQNELSSLQPILCINDNRINIILTPEFVYVEDLDSAWYRISLKDCKFVISHIHSVINGVKPKDCEVQARYPNGRNSDMNSEWTEQDWKYVCKVAFLTINCNKSVIEITASNFESYEQLARRLDNFRRKYYV